MWRAALVAFVLQGSTLQLSEPRLDASSDESLKRTMKQAAESLPAEQRRKLEEAVPLLFGDYIEKHPNEDASLAFKALFQGKTAREVIGEAEALVRRLIDTDRKRKQTTTSRSLPEARPVKTAALACEALVSTYIAPAVPTAADLLQLSEKSFMKPEAEQKRLLSEKRLEGSSSSGTDKLAIEVRGQNMQFVTGASVEAGAAFGPPFNVMKNDSTALAAVSLQEGVLGFTFSSFLLNKTNGFAIWTKSRPSFLTQSEPDTQAIYLVCR